MFYFQHLILKPFYLISDKNFGRYAETKLKEIYVYKIGGGHGVGARENRGGRGTGGRDKKGQEGGVLRGREAGEKCETLISQIGIRLKQHL